MRTSRLFGRRSHDEAREAGAPVLDIAVERFDYVPVDIGNALLRVTGVWGSPPGAVAPTLVAVAEPGRLRRSTAGMRETRAAVALRLRRLRVETSAPLALPDLTEGRSILLPLPSGGLADSEETKRHLEGLEAVRNELEAERGTRAELEAGLAQLRDDLIRAEQERDEASAGLQTRTAQLADAERLGTQVAGLEAEVTTLTARVEEAVATIEQLRTERTRVQEERSLAAAESR